MGKLIKKIKEAAAAKAAAANPKPGNGGGGIKSAAELYKQHKAKQGFGNADPVPAPASPAEAPVSAPATPAQPAGGMVEDAAEIERRKKITGIQL